MSVQDTIDHIRTVQANMVRCIEALQCRMLSHDSSKLYSPEERVAYDTLSERLEGKEYGSEEYRAVLRSIKPAVQHHYQHNAHHPEHYENGIQGMTLIDIVEMLCDWKAAAARNGGSVLDSLDHNQQRFGFSDDLKAILRNTLEQWLN